MLYMIVGEDRPASLEARLAARPAHLERLQALQAEGRLLLAGPVRPLMRLTPARLALPAA